MQIVSSPETEEFWALADRGILGAPRCLECQRFFFYPRDFCPRCWSTRIEWRALSGRGRLATYVIVDRPQPGVERRTPLVVALVELEEGIRLMANVVGLPADPSELALDLPLEVVFEHDGDRALPQFRPVSADG
jgi:uncharacterized OB-fold protein